ncbi:7-cyano-7-deazaguanine synthase QueC [Kordiimonas sp. SCSIO 12610]|uniref:7-cyano-7-deazaguanine synthase QueC n=1 Tax=Kordiimonas sp. SCSIO 12610 TaxID=2829597 RepID=UPI00210BA879|nr:7-cyano-7-deazaguanine synthase QueC [Kordiimonas sp. SCSIO 12610]UTW56636.1 7-cyano-7-deazaguanine synthase QueC [Kordiimonas sp. SCSIO 12610]
MAMKDAQNNKKAIVLLSGGLDSATVIRIAQDSGYDVYALSFQYGQRHSVELTAANKIAKTLGVIEHKTANLDLRLFGGSALTDDIDVPKDREDDDMSSDIPVTYVPARNTIFLSFALAYAETIGAKDIFIGVNALDYSGYPDCRPEYIDAYAKMANLATKAGVSDEEVIKIQTPLIDMTKAEIVSTGTKLGVDYSMTISCYDPDEDGRACGHCDSCLLRQKGFKEASLDDPTRYQNQGA